LSKKVLDHVCFYLDAFYNFNIDNLKCQFIMYLNREGDIRPEDFGIFIKDEETKKSVILE